MLTSKQYKELDKDSKKLFLQAHAPLNLKAGEVLLRKYKAIYVPHSQTWRMPDRLEMTQHKPYIDEITQDEKKIYINFQYQNQSKKLFRLMEQEQNDGKGLGDNRSSYVDMNGRVNHNIIKQGNFYFELVKDANTEIEFLSSLFIVAEIPDVALKKKEEPKKEEVKEATEEEKAIYAKWKESTPRLSKKEFTKQEKISIHKLNKAIKVNEVEI